MILSEYTQLLLGVSIETHVQLGALVSTYRDKE